MPNDQVRDFIDKSDEVGLFNSDISNQYPGPWSISVSPRMFDWLKGLPSVRVVTGAQQPKIPPEMEAVVQPRYLYVTPMPVFASFEIKGLDKSDSPTEPK